MPGRRAGRFVTRWWHGSAACRLAVGRAGVAAAVLLVAVPGCGLVRPRSTELGAGAGAKPVKREGSRSLDLSICLETAELARKRGMDEEAIEQFKRARQIDPDVTGVAHPLAVLYDRAGRADAAEREYLAALEESPNDPDVLCGYGYFLYSRDRIEEAEAKLRESLERAPQHRQAQINLGLVLGSRGEYAEAESLFRRAIGPAAAHNVGMLKLRAEDESAAVADLRSAAARDPSLEATREVIAAVSGQIRMADRGALGRAGEGDVVREPTEKSVRKSAEKPGRETAGKIGGGDQSRQPLQRPRRRISVTSPTDLLWRRLPAVSWTSSRQVTEPQSTQTKWGWAAWLGCCGSIASNRHTWSPSSVRRSNPASARSLRFRNAVALSTPVRLNSSATSACVNGEGFSRTIRRVAIRAGVARRPTDRMSFRAVSNPVTSPIDSGTFRFRFE